MSRFEANSFYHKCYSEIIKRARRAELDLQAETPEAPAMVRGLYLRQSLSLPGDAPWWLSGQFQCHDHNYLNFLVFGVDRSENSQILRFTISLFDVGLVGDLPEDQVQRHLDNDNNATLVWEYTHGLTDLDTGLLLGLHVHRFGQYPRRFYKPQPPVTVTPEYWAIVLDAAIGAISDPDAFWGWVGLRHSSNIPVIHRAK